jgi:hypothetical protein
VLCIVALLQVSKMQEFYHFLFWQLLVHLGLLIDAELFDFICGSYIRSFVILVLLLLDYISRGLRILNSKKNLDDLIDFLVSFVYFVHFILLLVFIDLSFFALLLHLLLIINFDRIILLVPVEYFIIVGL